ncbi:hypothetical protein PoB_005071700 [Plakobranchus ocellatus]|uniref:RNase H type-1 domain-containing protein n=1 Tax=Plakobranchus ocellatus TaxID=259542 RepID=A0AAV4BYT4_9GAST|nr:hypothetical protein PoB_005071700 [Plakobranchus ocellatus]
MSLWRVSSFKGNSPRHWKVSPLPGVTTFTNCQAFGQASDGSVKANVVQLADLLRKAENVLPSYVGIIGNEIADKLANEGMLQPHSLKPLTLSDVKAVLRDRTVELWNLAQCPADKRFPKFYEGKGKGFSFEKKVASGALVSNYALVFAEISGS